MFKSRLISILLVTASTISPSLSIALISNGLSQEIAQAAPSVSKPTIFGKFGTPIDVKPPVAAEKTDALVKSLSPEQQTALQAILNRYQPQFAFLLKQLPKPSGSVPNPSASTESQRQAKVQSQLVKDQAVADKLSALQVQVDREVASVLTPTQFETFKAGANPTPEELAGAISGLQKASKSSPRNSLYLAYGRFYASQGVTYARYQFLFAYYSYIFTGNTNCFLAYYYSYFAYAYSIAASNAFNSGNYSLAYIYAYYAYYYAYNAYNYAYACYQQTGNYFAYISYYYGYYAACYLYYSYFWGYYGYFLR